MIYCNNHTLNDMQGYVYSKVAVIPAAAKPFVIIVLFPFMWLNAFLIHWAPSGFIIDIRKSTGGGISSLKFLYTTELYHSLNCCFMEFLSALLTLKSIGYNLSVQLAGMVTT